MTRLKESQLYIALSEKHDSDKILPIVEKIVEFVSPLLQRIPEHMPEFTLHDPNHSVKIIEIISKITPKEVIDNLNSIELSLLILSAYLHDIGMTCDRAEKEKIISSNEDFDILFKSNNYKYQKFEQYKIEGNHRAATFIQDQIFTEYLRLNHVNRSAKFIADNLSSGTYSLTYNDIPFYKLLIKICDAHGEPVKKIYDNSIWPKETLVGENIINIQYLSLLLRLGDILDLDAERTPKVIYEFVNPENPISILEWKKHRSIIGSSINEKKILFEAECSSPEVERALRQFINWIEIERSETMELLKSYNNEESSKYYLSLNDSITPNRIYSDGTYIYNDLMFSLDYQRIMTLLMGQKLYKDPATAIRELLQNSIDAIKVRQKVYENRLEKITPLIKLELLDNTLSIEDNGIGMNKEIFQNFFLQIGKSYYSSQIFYSRFSDLDVTSEFGIGILSAFMVATSFTIDSRREPDEPLHPFDPIHFEIPAAQSYLIQREGNRRDIGTKINLFLKELNPFQNKSVLIDILNEIIPNPPFPIIVSCNGNEETYNGRQTVQINELIYDINDAGDFLERNRILNFDWDEKFTHSLLSINFQSDSDQQLRNIHGDLILVNSNPINYYSTFSGTLSHRSFAVGFPETIKDKFKLKATESVRSLFPKWFSYLSNLNLTGSACLSITPDRCDFTVDENFKVLKAKIEKKIINELDNYLELFLTKNGIEETSKFLDFLFVSGFFGFDLDEIRKGIEMTQNSKDFFLKWITFPILNEKGEITRVKLEKIINRENIAVILKKITQNETSALIEFKKKNDIEVILLGNFEYASHRHETLFLLMFGSTKHFIKPMKLLLKPLFGFPIYVHRYNSKQIENEQDYDEILCISNSDNMNKDISVIFFTRDTHFHPQINISSPFVSFIFEDNQIATKEKTILKEELMTGLRKILSNSLKKLKQSDNPEFIKVAYSDYSHLALQGILKKDPELLENIDNFFNEIWLKAKESGVIDKNKKKPVIKKDHLPWFWSN